MSNEKVLRRKQEKYNRKRNEVKRKIKDVVVGVSVALIIVAMLGVMGYQIFEDYIKYDTIQKIDLTAMVEAMGKVESASVEEESTEDAEVTTEDEIFPKIFSCPVCSKRLKATKSGRFRCSECKTILAIDNSGQVFLG